MKQTTNYALNQWAGGDRLLCADFNSDNSKIDAALKAVSDAANAEKPGLVKIREIITQSTVWQIDLDVSDIDWNKYSQVECYVYPVPIPNSGGGMNVRLNGITADSTYYELMPNGGGSNVMAQFAQLSYVAAPARSQCRLTFFAGCSTVNGKSASYAYSPMPKYLNTNASRISYETLTTLNIIGETRNIMAGCKILFYGVRV